MLPDNFINLVDLPLRLLNVEPEYQGDDQQQSRRIRFRTPMWFVN